MPALTWPDLREMLAQHAPQCTTFVETGTFMGETIANMKAHFARVDTIEVKRSFYERAVQRFGGDAHVTCHCVCWVIFAQRSTRQRAFGLTGTTGHGEKMVPLYEELEANMKHCAPACFICRARVD